MIHFAIGTKAQFIKMAPVMHLLQEQDETYHLLDLSQHGSLTGKILDDFALQPILTTLGKRRTSVETYTQAIAWFSRGFWQVMAHKPRLRGRLFLDRGGIVLLHGDTLSTLLGLHLARAAGLKTGLIEAGLSSGNLIDPFPEEWIRRYTSRRADILFPPDKNAESWLQAQGYEGNIVNTGYNTGKDALELINKRFAQASRFTGEYAPYGVLTLHRVETLSSKRRLTSVTRHILRLAEHIGPLRFYLHPPTENALLAYGLMESLLMSKNIEVHKLMPYPEFIRALMHARIILTDGGSIQEEASYLNKPCLILRNRTERVDGLEKNAMLSTWSVEKDIDHLMRAERRSQVSVTHSELGASKRILEALAAFRDRH